MSSTDGTEYGEKLRRIFKRNMEKDNPKSGIVLMLAQWRELRSELTREANREFALDCLKRERDETPKTPHISRLLGSDEPKEGAEIIALFR